MRRCYRVCKMKAAIQSITWPPEYSGSRQVHVVRMVRSAASRLSGGDPGRPCRRAFESAVIGEALRYLPRERIITCTNCGMAPMRRDIAAAKLVALGAGAKLARERFG